MADRVAADYLISAMGIDLRAVFAFQMMRSGDHDYCKALFRCLEIAPAAMSCPSHSRRVQAGAKSRSLLICSESRTAKTFSPKLAAAVGLIQLFYLLLLIRIPVPIFGIHKFVVLCSLPDGIGLDCFGPKLTVDIYLSCWAEPNITA